MPHSPTCSQPGSHALASNLKRRSSASYSRRRGCNVPSWHRTRRLHHSSVPSDDRARRESGVLVILARGIEKTHGKRRSKGLPSSPQCDAVATRRKKNGMASSQPSQRAARGRTDERTNGRTDEGNILARRCPSASQANFLVATRRRAGNITPTATLVDTTQAQSGQWGRRAPGVVRSCASLAL